MVHKIRKMSAFEKMLLETGGHVDIHVQRKDYGWMLSNRVVRNKADAVSQAKDMWVSLMTSSSNDNEVTRKRFYGKYFKSSPFVITVMPKDAMKGTVMFDDFGKLPSDFVFREKSD
jgi:hypothetical protein